MMTQLSQIESVMRRTRRLIGRRILRWVQYIAVFAVLASMESANAQEYRFHVERMDLEIHALSNGSARLEYSIDFANSPQGRAIDIVDIGLPHGDYHISNMTASIDGKPLRTIRKSEYIDVGVEVPLGGLVILPGQRGTFHFACTMPDMIYQDTTDDDLASLQIRATWFDPQLQVGLTHLRMAVHLPPGFGADEIKYHDESTRYAALATVGEGDESHVVALWEWQNHLLSSANPKIGISFPKRGMKVVHITRIGLFVKWFSESQTARLLSGWSLLAVFLFLFIRFSGGTGWVVCAVVVALGLFMLRGNPVLHLWAWPIVVGLIAAAEWFRWGRNKSYLPAMATIEGGGIKRGLTAPQAAILLELPLEKVLTLVMFGLLKKEVIRIVESEPLRVAVDSRFAVPHANRRKAAAKLGTVIHEYEHWFIERLIGWDKPVVDRDLSHALGKLIKTTTGTMRGFDLSDSQEYYRRIVARAWREANTQVDLGKRTEAVDRNLEWMLLDPDSGDRFTTWHTGGYRYYPSWGGPSSSVGLPTSPASGTSVPRSQTSLGEVASSFSGWMENTAGGLAGAIEPSSLGLKTPGGQIIDLSGVDRVTGEVFAALGKSGGSGGRGGGGGGCACACAGCACACACAGGGR